MTPRCGSLFQAFPGPPAAWRVPRLWALPTLRLDRGGRNGSRRLTGDVGLTNTTTAKIHRQTWVEANQSWSLSDFKHTTHTVFLINLCLVHLVVQIPYLSNKTHHSCWHPASTIMGLTDTTKHNWDLKLAEMTSQRIKQEVKPVDFLSSYPLFNLELVHHPSIIIYQFSSKKCKSMVCFSDFMQRHKVLPPLAKLVVSKNTH